MQVQPRTFSHDDRKTPSKTRRHNDPCWLSTDCVGAKELYLNLAGWHMLLLIQQVKKSSESEVHRVAPRFQPVIYTIPSKKSSVFSKFLKRRQKKGKRRLTVRAEGSFSDTPFQTNHHCCPFYFRLLPGKAPAGESGNNCSVQNEANWTGYMLPYMRHGNSMDGMFFCTVSGVDFTVLGG